jgi:hypothetical protein
MVVYLHARVRLHGSVDWVDGRFADGLERVYRAESRTEALGALEGLKANEDRRPSNSKPRAVLQESAANKCF